MTFDDYHTLCAELRAMRAEGVSLTAALRAMWPDVSAMVGRGRMIPLSRFAADLGETYYGAKSAMQRLRYEKNQIKPKQRKEGKTEVPVSHKQEEPSAEQKQEDEWIDRGDGTEYKREGPEIVVRDKETKQTIKRFFE
ncbi:hypothetical protein [Arhodomonas sp. SL1]|uniref:hypothetical protein n=1 Tax=Arhodomonas sp. SL1 TaxID=3425691 RepID=UPI003F88073F